MTIVCTNIQIGINIMLVGLMIWNVLHALRLRREYTKIRDGYRQLGDAYVELQKDREKLLESCVAMERVMKGTN